MMQVIDGGRAVIHCGDCQDVLPKIVAPVDHFILDPPYEAAMHEAKGKGRRVRTDNGADLRKLSFASIEAIRAWVAANCKGRGWFLAFCTPEGVAPWRDALEAAGHRYKRACVWVKPDASPQFNGQGPGYAAEMFVTTWTGRGVSRWNGGGRSNVFTHLTNPADREGSHPTEKPVALMMEIVEKFTNPGDTICDPFMGTGATGVAALRLGRRFVGIEQNAGYYQTALGRLRLVGASDDLFAPRARPIQTRLGQWPAQRKPSEQSDGKTVKRGAAP